MVAAWMSHISGDVGEEVQELCCYLIYRLTYAAIEKKPVRIVWCSPFSMETEGKTKEMRTKSEGQWVRTRGEAPTGIAALLYKTKAAVKWQEMGKRRSLKQRKMQKIVSFRFDWDVNRQETCLGFFCDCSSITTATPCFLAAFNKQREQEEFTLGQFHLWPLFIQSPSNHSSLAPKSASSNLQNVSSRALYNYNATRQLYRSPEGFLGTNFLLHWFKNNN